MASDEKVVDGCMCCIDRLRWQLFAALEGGNLNVSFLVSGRSKLLD